MVYAKLFASNQTVLAKMIIQLFFETLYSFPLVEVYNCKLNLAGHTSEFHFSNWPERGQKSKTWVGATQGCTLHYMLQCLLHHGK